MTQLYLADFVKAFPKAHGNHGNTLWQAVVASLRPTDLPSETDFVDQLERRLQKLRQVGASARDCRHVKRVLCASYWPGPPGSPELIEVVGNEYRTGLWLTAIGLRNYVAYLKVQPALLQSLPGISRAGLVVLDHLARSAPEQP